MAFRLDIPDHDPAQPIVFDFAYRQGGGPGTGSPDPIIVAPGYPYPTWYYSDSVVDHGTYFTSRITFMSETTGFGLRTNLRADDHENLAYTELYSATVTYTPLVKGSWPLRQRQTLTGSPSWPLRQRQNGGHSGSWPLRQRQRGT